MEFFRQVFFCIYTSFYSYLFIYTHQFSRVMSHETLQWEQLTRWRFFYRSLFVYTPLLQFFFHLNTFFFGMLSLAWHDSECQSLYVVFYTSLFIYAVVFWHFTFCKTWDGEHVSILILFTSCFYRSLFIYIPLFWHVIPRETWQWHEIGEHVSILILFTSFFSILHTSFWTNSFPAKQIMRVGLYIDLF